MPMRFAFAAMVAYDGCPSVEVQSHILGYSQAGAGSKGAMLMTAKVDSRKARCAKRVDVGFQFFLSIEANLPVRTRCLKVRRTKRSTTLLSFRSSIRVFEESRNSQCDRIIRQAGDLV